MRWPHTIRQRPYRMQNSAADAHQTWTIQKLIRWAEGYLKKHGVDSPRLSAELLLSTALGTSRLDLYLNFAKPLEDVELQEFKRLLLRRARREPLAYITGVKEFWSLELKVTPTVLIPRPETECLVEAALSILDEHAKNDIWRILDLGTGSGAIVIALTTEQPQHSFTATDLSADAIRLATENACRHKVDKRIDFICSDWFNEINLSGKRFDLIVTNPPYIPTGDLPQLAPEIVNYEPHLALDGTPDGLASIRHIIENAPQFLKAGGRLLMEIGHDQSSAVQKMVTSVGAYAETGFRKDLAGHDRVAVLIKK